MVHALYRCWIVRYQPACVLSCAARPECRPESCLLGTIETARAIRSAAMAEKEFRVAITTIGDGGIGKAYRIRPSCTYSVGKTYLCSRIVKDEYPDVVPVSLGHSEMNLVFNGRSCVMVLRGTCAAHECKISLVDAEGSSHSSVDSTIRHLNYFGSDLFFVWCVPPFTP